MEKLSLHCLPSDPNIRKEWMNFIINEVPVLLLIKFVSVRTWSKDDAVPTILDSNTQHNRSVSNCFYYVITIASSVITDDLKFMHF